MIHGFALGSPRSFFSRESGRYLPGMLNEERSVTNDSLSQVYSFLPLDERINPFKYYSIFLDAR